MKQLRITLLAGWLAFNLTSCNGSTGAGDGTGGAAGIGGAGAAGVTGAGGTSGAGGSTGDGGGAVAGSGGNAVAGTGGGSAAGDAGAGGQTAGSGGAGGASAGANGSAGRGGAIGAAGTGMAGQAGGIAGVGGGGRGGGGGTTAGKGGVSGGTGGATGTGGAAGSTGFFHPGLLLTVGDIARMKAKIASKSDPWYSNYNALVANQNSSATKAFTTPPAIIGRNAASAYASNRYACEGDAVVAFQNALVYVLTGQTAHADQTVKILNAYAAGVKHFDGVDPERDLEAAILGWLWVSTAELIRYSGYAYTGWAAADVSKFNAWIRNVVYADTAYNAAGVLVTPLVNGAGARGAFGLRTKIAIGVYLDDRGIFDAAVDYFFHGQGNGAPQYYVNPTTGQTWESGRDQGHAQGGLSRLVETAHIAHNQGNETLYAWGNDGLMRAVEYIASYNLGNNVPYGPMQPYTLDWSAVYTTISSDGRGQLATIYELPYSYFHDTRGLNMPYAMQAIGVEGAETFSAQNDNPMFATLSYRR